MANDPRVRAILEQRGIPLSDEVVFVGGYHNTCDDSLRYFDLDEVPRGHLSALSEAQKVLELARRRDAHERCRRFELAPLFLSNEEALRQVETRAEDLSQVRPEYGHATNSICVVGRRERTRNLFMDRRTFLASYDPLRDTAEHDVLARILNAVFPVCGGINLEYYFSFTDSTGWGCGTKLPHNITSLLGVMDGAASDLRTGLPWQMVEIHEPVRLLMVIETTRQAMESIMDRNASISNLCRNHWVQLALLDPHSPEICVYRRGEFESYRPSSHELPIVESSEDWYRGWRDHLGFAQIREAWTATGQDALLQESRGE
jgi:uncharacterized protein YbcC (UPF0753/DUF2309 family)